MVCLLTTVLAREATAQTDGDVRLEAGTATALPVGEVDDQAALYGLTGLSLYWASERAEMSAALYGGIALNGAAGGDFASAVLRVEGWSAGSGLALGIAGRAYGFNVGEPFPYRNGTLWAGPAVRWAAGEAVLEARAEAGTGASEVELSARQDRATHLLEEHLWHRGAVLEGSLEGSRISAEASAGVWTSAGGNFRSVEIGLTGGGSRVAVRGEVGWWETPLGGDWVGGLALVVPLGGRWSVQATGGRAGPDPLTLVDAGSQGGVLFGWRLATLGGGGELGLYELGDETGEGRVVRFRLDRPEATRVDVLGGFTGWEPLPMARSEETWRLELSVAPGIHHFGFLVDGEWYVPDGMPGNVPDDWGRVNATLVVPSASQEP
jgi:hypothetical protein